MALIANRLSGLFAPGSRARWALPRLLAASAALLVGFALWSPWLAITFQLFPGVPGAPPRPYYLDTAGGVPYALTLSFGQQSLAGGNFSPHAYAVATFAANACLIVISALGILLAPLLWLHTRTRGVRLALIAFGVWLLAATLYPLGLEATAWVGFNRLYSQFDSHAGGISYSPGLGLFLLLAGLLLGWTSLILLARQRPLAPAPAAPALPATSRVRAGMTLLSGGLLLWAVGFLAVPWAQVNCASIPVTLNHFVEGTCAGLDAGDALTTLFSSRIPAAVWDWLGGIYALYGVLIGGGLLALIATWRRASSRTVRAWIALWLLAATAVTALGFRGVDHIAAAAPALSSQATGVWHAATGIPLSFLGLLLAWLGMLAFDGASRQPAASPSSQPTEGVPALPASGE